MVLLRMSLLRRLLTKRIKLTNYSQKCNLTTKNDDGKDKDLVFKDSIKGISETKTKLKPQRLPAFDEEKDVWPVLKASVKNLINLKTTPDTLTQCEVLIIGGGIMGSFTAYWVKTMFPSFTVIVVERDNDYTESSTFWSVGGFRQQFSLPENIKMSLFGADFLRTAKISLKVNNDIETREVDLDISHDGYLFLATKKTAEQMVKNHKIQLNQQAKVRLYNSDELKDKFDWLNTEDIELASFGYMNEGWVDPKKYLFAVRYKAQSLGVEYVRGQLVEFEFSSMNETGYGSVRQLKKGLIDTFDGKLIPISFANVVNCAGPWAADVAKIAGIGNEFDDEKNMLMPLDSLRTELPVEPRKRYIYLFEAENGPVLNVPLTIDHTGVFFKRHGIGNQYLCGLNQNEESEPANLSLGEIDYDYFAQKIKPVLIRRVPAFKNIKLLQAWAGYYDYNTFDQNLIIGRHYLHKNFIFANGSSGHGLQHAAAIGRAIAELISANKYETIDLSRFSFERVVLNLPVREIGVV